FRSCPSPQEGSRTRTSPFSSAKSCANRRRPRRAAKSGGVKCAPVAFRCATAHLARACIIYPSFLLLNNPYSTRHANYRQVSFAQLDPDRAVAAQAAGARQDQVAQARESRQRLAPRAARFGESRDLGEPARNQSRRRVMAQSESLHHAGGDRNDVLERPAQFH